MGVFEIGNKLGKIRCSCILSGSAPYMRDLCFGKLSDPMDKRFPSYTGIARNLNSQRFKVIPHNNLQDKRELTKFLDHIAKKWTTRNNYWTITRKNYFFGLVEI